MANLAEQMIELSIDEMSDSQFIEEVMNLLEEDEFLEVLEEEGVTDEELESLLTFYEEINEKMSVGQWLKDKKTKLLNKKKNKNKKRTSAQKAGAKKGAKARMAGMAQAIKKRLKTMAKRAAAGFYKKK